MPQDGETSLVIPVPAADPLLRGLARAFPGSVRDGVPAHISILHPFLPYLEVDDRVTEVLGSVFAAHGPARVSFQTCERDADFVHLLPQPAGAVDDVIHAVRTAWPHILPYGGRFGDGRSGPALGELPVAARGGSVGGDARGVLRRMASRVAVRLWDGVKRARAPACA